MNTNYKQMLEKQDTEFFQSALITLLRRAGGTMAFTQAEINDSGRFMGDITEINGRFVIKIISKPVDFDEKKAQEFFDEARRNAQAMSTV